MPTALPKLKIGLPRALHAAAELKPVHSSTVPKLDAWKEWFPVGFWLTPTSLTVRDPHVTTTTTRSLSDQNGWRGVNASRDVGFTTLEMRDSYWTGGNTYTMEDSLNLFHIIGDEFRGKIVPGIAGRSNADPNSGITKEWFENPANTSPTYAAAVTMATPIVANVQDHPAIMAYQIRDDVTNATIPAVAPYGTTNRGEQAMIMMKAIQDLDPYGRPCVFVCNDTAVWDRDEDSLKVVNFYRYPCGRLYKASGTAPFTETLEGDFHRGSFSAAGGAGVTDWVDELRVRVDSLPSRVYAWTELQTHQTSHLDNGQGTLRRPTTREYRKQFWIAIGENIKGLFWFTFDGYAAVNAPDVGVGDATRSAELGVIRELNERLTPDIREILLHCDRDSPDTFGASGGGRSGDIPVGYANAYISTLTDQRDSTKYVVVCNHALSTSSVDIYGLTGWLESMETGERIGLPATVSLPALDGSIYRHIPLTSVPEIKPDYEITVEEWWDAHPYNPDATFYIGSGDIGAKDRVITVNVGDILQDVVDDNPGDNITFSLAANYVSNATVNVVGRSGIQFVSADPAHRATLRRLYIYGSLHALWYNGGDLCQPPGFVALVEAGTAASSMSRADATWATFIEESIYAWDHPAHDFLIRDIDFVGDGISAEYGWCRMNNTGATNQFWSRNHWCSGTPIWVRNCSDGIVEGCTFTGYVQSTDMDTNADGVPDAASNVVGTPSQFHSGFVGGNGGIKNWCVRECTFTPPNDARGWPYAVFFDGARGCVVENNTFNTPKYINGTVLGLTNDDYSFDADRDGRFGVDHDNRMAHYWVVANNRFGVSPLSVAITGFSNLVTDNTINMTGTTISRIVYLPGRCCRRSVQGFVYEAYNNVIKNNVLACNAVTKFVEHDPDDTWTGCSGVGSGTAAYAYRGRIGKSKVTGNSVSGTVTRWIDDETGSTLASETPHTVSGNNKNDSSGVGI